MKEKISQLMDGDLAGREADGALMALKSEREAIEAWRTYHLISDSLRETRVLSPGFTERVAARLAGEPAVRAPLRWPRFEHGFELRAAAVLVVVAVVGVMMAIDKWQPSTGAQLAQSPQPVQGAAAGPAPREKAEEPARTALPEGARDYLLAHQSYAPPYALQGYARTVSDIAGSRW